MTRPRIECQSPGALANTLLIWLITPIISFFFQTKHTRNLFLVAKLLYYLSLSWGGVEQMDSCLSQGH